MPPPPVREANRRRDPDARLSGRSAAIVAAYGLVILLVQFGTPWALTFHEVNFAEPAREFLRNGDWLVPRLAGRPLWDKPPLMHWSIAASVSAFGTEAEWAARLPSTLSAVVVALAVAGLAARWHGDRVGLLAGLVQLTSIYMLMHARLAEADMPLCAAVTVAMAALARGAAGWDPGDHVPIGWILTFFGASGIAFLAKGPIGPALIASGAGLFAIVERRGAPWRLLLDPFGWALMLLLILVWPLAAIVREPGLPEVWWRHNADRFGGGLDGGVRGPAFYLYTAAWLALPWTPVALAGFVAGIRSNRAPGPFWRLLGCWLLGGSALLTFSAWKHKHYIIPCLPPLSIWAAFGLSRLLDRSAGFAPPPRVGGWLRRQAVPSLIVVGSASMTSMLARRFADPTTATAIGIAAGLGLAGLAACRTFRHVGRPGAAIGSLFGGIGAAVIVVQSLALPAFDLYRAQAEFAQRLGETLPEGAEIAVVGLPDPQVMYYLPLPLRRLDGVPELADRLEAEPSPVIYIVGPLRELGALRTLGAVRVLDRAASVHPRKGEADRLVAVMLRPEGSRLANAADRDRPSNR